MPRPMMTVWPVAAAWCAYADGTWPPESDGPFATYSMQHIIPELRSRLLFIETLAHELSVHGSLTQENIEAIRLDMSSCL